MPSIIPAIAAESGLQTNAVTIAAITAEIIIAASVPTVFLNPLIKPFIRLIKTINAVKATKTRLTNAITSFTKPFLQCI